MTSRFFSFLLLFKEARVIVDGHAHASCYQSFLVNEIRKTRIQCFMFAVKTRDHGPGFVFVPSVHFSYSCHLCAVLDLSLQIRPS